MIRTTTRTLFSSLALSVLAVTGCAATPPASAEAASAGDVITIDDAWVKSADSGMTAGFGVLTNTGDDDVTVVAVTSDASTTAELHETVVDQSGAMVMRPVEGGFIVPAGEDFVLEPAADHIMMMGVVDPLAAGDEVAFTLEFADGSSYAFVAVVKDYSGANESYVGEGGMDTGGDE